MCDPVMASSAATIMASFAQMQKGQGAPAKGNAQTQAAKPNASATSAQGAAPKAAPAANAGQSAAETLYPSQGQGAQVTDPVGLLEKAAQAGGQNV